MKLYFRLFKKETSKTKWTYRTVVIMQRNTCCYLQDLCSRISFNSFVGNIKVDKSFVKYRVILRTVHLDQQYAEHKLFVIVNHYSNLNLKMTSSVPQTLKKSWQPLIQYIMQLVDEKTNTNNVTEKIGALQTMD